MLTKFKFAILIIIIFTACFAENGVGVYIGYQFNDSEAAKKSAEYLDLKISKTYPIVADLHSFWVANEFMRWGGLFSGKYWQEKKTYTSSVTGTADFKLSYVDVSLCLVPEIYLHFGPFGAAGGLGVGVGSRFLAVRAPFNKDDDTKLYAFCRPQLTGAINIRNFSIHAGLGYHLPFAGTKGEYVIVNEEGVRITETVDLSDLGGFFVNAGIVLGPLWINNK